jgi:enoyl-[acyl-carrier protein] reductase II
MRTRLTDMLEVEHPVMLAGMGGVSYSGLVAAVSEAGGFGCLGASTMQPDQMVAEMRTVKKLTDKPFGVDLLTAASRDMAAQVKLIIDEGARVFVAGLGVPRDVIDLCHQHNILVVNMCGRVRHAVAAVEAGCDIVVAQGTEAGGHTGQVATFPLVPQMVDAVGDRVPVVAAGGISDGRHLAAALALGADGIWVGTRFIATPEARAVPGYKDALLRSAEDATVISRAFTGKTLRALRNSYTQYFEEHPDELQPFPMQIGRSLRDNAWHLGGDENTAIDPDKECFPAGQGVGAITELLPAGELVRRFAREAEETLDRITAMRLPAPGRSTVDDRQRA